MADRALVDPPRRRDGSERMTHDFLDSWLRLDDIFEPGEAGTRALADLAARLDDIRQDADRSEETGMFPDATFVALKAAGLMGAVIPENQGGRGLTDEQYCLLAGHLATANPSAALAFNMHCAALISIDAFASPALKSECFGLVCGDGAKVAGLGSEPGLKPMATGAPPSTRLEADGEGYRLTGRKSYSSFGDSADLLYVTCVLDGRVAFALVDAHSPGISRRDDWDVTAMRSTRSVTTEFASVFVPASRLVFPEDPFRALLFETEFALGYGPIYLSVAGEALRLAFASLPEARAEAPSEIWFERAGHAYGEFTAAALICRQAALSHGRGEFLRARDLIMAKGYACRKAYELGELALEAGGGATLRAADRVGRLSRDLRAGLVMAFTPTDAKLMLGRVMMGHPPDYVADRKI